MYSLQSGKDPPGPAPQGALVGLAPKQKAKSP